MFAKWFVGLANPWTIGGYPTESIKERFLVFFAVSGYTPDVFDRMEIASL